MEKKIVKLDLYDFSQRQKMLGKMALFLYLQWRIKKMKKSLIITLILSSTLMAEEISQYEALQKLNQVSGKLILENQQIKSDIVKIQNKLHIPNNEESSNDSSDIKNSIDLIFSRLDTIEEKVRLLENDKNNKKTEFITNSPEYKTYIVNTKLLNVRNQTNLNASIVEQYKFGKEFIGIDLKNGWVQVKNNIQYISKIYLIEKK